MTSSIPFAADVDARQDILVAVTIELQDVLVAVARLEAIRAGRTQTVPLAHVVKRHFP